MTIKELIIDYLEQNGYDGLCMPEFECGCIKADLIACNSNFQDCEPAFKVEQEDGDYIMTTIKEQENERD